MSVTTNSSLPTYSVKVNGAAISNTIFIISVSVSKQVNDYAKATITVLDGSPESATFEVSSSDIFVPGNTIEIMAGYDGNESLLFSGMVTGQSLVIDQEVGSLLLVECCDLCVKMTVAGNAKTFYNTSDSAIIQSIVQNYSGISASITATDLTVQQQMQASVTDWDFILSLAGSNGMIVSAVNNRLTVAPPDAQTTDVLTVTFGDNLLDFNANLDSVQQLAAVEVSSWDVTQQVVQSTKENNTYPGPGNLSSITLSKVVGLSEYPLETTTMLSQSERSLRAKATLTKANYAKIVGNAKIKGTTLVEPACYIELAGLGTRFNGSHFVSGIIHTLAEGNWNSDISIGLPAEWLPTQQIVNSESLQGIKGLYNATVKQIGNNPSDPFSILVTVPVLDPSETGIWARISQFYASNGAGAFFMPEVGDEVIVGFLNDDSGSPVILGSVYSNPQHEPNTGLQLEETNPLKAIVSKSGIALTFDDLNKVLTLKTPSGNTITLSDLNKQILIQDQNGNHLNLSDFGISMKSEKNISIQSDQTLSLEGNMGIQLKSSGGDISLEGMNIKETAQSTYSANAGLTIDIESGTEMKLKSGMIHIN
jgi:Rhs element Vgr protein